ncbi:MAG: cytochrome c1 [Alphaproteobacteria bacterium]|jgi:ubiquinol-cytochrome c reductase cytochrome c1 subunit|nr:cytochrome c1 [Alphaproteobacteria bacterium]
MAATMRMLLAAGALLLAGIQVSLAAGGGAELKSRSWPHGGPFGSFDYASVQRGFQVYSEVCAGCHSAKYLYYRNLRQIGLSEAEVKALAAEAMVMDGPNDEGEMFERSGKPADPLPRPFANDQAARAANNGSLPPDLSLIVKARIGHEDYIYSLLTGYAEPPAGTELREGMSYNPYFAGSQIAMAQPMEDDAVEYADGTKATTDQMAYDVVNFLAWASEPTLEARKSMGIKVVLFLLLFSVLAYVVKRKVWADLH